jgi:hypothetical protein
VPEGASIAELRRRPRMGGGFGSGEGTSRVKCLGGFSSRGSGAIERAAADAQSIAHRIAQNAPHPKKFTAPAGLDRLLEEGTFAPRR